MTEQDPAAEQTQEQAVANGVNVFRNIVSLLKGALHPGAHAQYVTEAISFLEQVIAKETEVAAAAAAVPPTLTVVI